MRATWKHLDPFFWLLPLLVAWALLAAQPFGLKPASGQNSFLETASGGFALREAAPRLGFQPAAENQAAGDSVVANSGEALTFGANGRKLDFLFNRNIDQSNAYNALRAEGNASRIGIADTPANRSEVTRLFNEAYNNPVTIVGPGKLSGSNVREFFLPGVTGTGSKIQFVEQNGKVITIMAK